MSRDVLFSNTELQQWVDDGGRSSPDEDAELERLEDLATLRNALVSRAASRSEIELLFDYVNGVLSASEFGKLLGLNRSNGLRRLRGGLARFGRKLLSDPSFLQEVPERFRHLFPA